MTLKTDYNFNAQMATVFDLGKSLIAALPTPTPAYTTIAAAMAANAAAGNKQFTVNVAHNANNSNLELGGEYWRSYQAGILAALSDEDVYPHEVSVVINKAVAALASIDLKFSF